MRTPIFRYVGLAVKKNGVSFTYLPDYPHARQIAIDRCLEIGAELDWYDDEDRATYTYRILRVDGTVYNKSKQELEREKEVKVA